MDNRTDSLRNKATTGVVWSAFERFGQQSCAFFIQVVLARLLVPEEFGLIAMVMVFVAIMNVIADCGFSRAIIQRQELVKADLDTVFYFNVCIACLLYAVLIFIAPWIAHFYNQPLLVPILRCLGVSLILGSFGAVHSALLNREMQFKSLFKATLPSTLISGGIGIACALFGLGVWALVVQILIQRLVFSLSLWFVGTWRPQCGFSFMRLKAMFPFASKLALASILDTAFNNLYVLVIGRVYAPVDVGYFQRARAFQQLPTVNLQQILGRVAFPLLSSVQDNPVRAKSIMRKGMQLSSLMSFMAMAVLAAVAEPMVRSLIGERWSPCVPYLQILCLVGALYPLSSLNLSLLMSFGRADLYLRLEVIKKIMVLANIAITLSYGIQEMVYGMVVTSFLSYFLNQYYTAKYIYYGIFEQLSDILRNAILASILCAIVFFSQSLLETSDFVSLILSLLLAVCCGLLMVQFVSAELKSEIRRVFDGIAPRFINRQKKYDLY